jgi:putative ABC transport system permease protein
VSVSLTLAWRYLWGRKLRTLLTTLAVVFGVMIIFGLNGMLPGMIDAFNRMIVGATGQVDLSVTSTSGDYFDPSAAETVAQVDGVAAATPLLRRSVGMPTDSGVSTLMLMGIEPRTAIRVHDYAVSSGRMLTAGDRGHIVIGRDTAEKLGVRLGGTLTIPRLRAHSATP